MSSHFIFVSVLRCKCWVVDIDADTKLRTVKQMSRVTQLVHRRTGPGVHACWLLLFWQDSPWVPGQGSLYNPSATQGPWDLSQIVSTASSIAWGNLIPFRGVRPLGFLKQNPAPLLTAAKNPLAPKIDAIGRFDWILSVMGKGYITSTDFLYSSSSLPLLPFFLNSPFLCRAVWLLLQA